MKINKDGRSLKLLDTVKIIKTDLNGEIIALKGECKAGDLRE